MRRILIGLAVVVVVLAGALVVLPHLIPSSVWRKQIETVASQSLGRAVTVTGDIRVSIFPRIEARAGAAAIANPEGFGEAPFASMQELRAAVKLWPLIFQKVEIAEFVLVEPAIDLIALEDGRNNWTFDFPAAKQPEAGGPSSLPAEIGDVRISGGRVSFTDRKAGAAHTLKDFDLRIAMTRFDRPADFRASGVANDLPFKLTANVGNLSALLSGAATPFRTDLETALVTAHVDGSLVLGEAPQLDIAFKGEIPDAPALADAFRIAELPGRTALGKVSLAGRALGWPGDLLLKVETARHESPSFAAGFRGDVRFASQIAVSGEADAEVADLSALAKAFAFDAPAAQALGKATAKAKISGVAGDLRFEGVHFRHVSALLGLAFDGTARLQQAPRFAGRVSINAPDLRGLAAATGAKLPEGPVYRTFALSGDTSGDGKDVLLRNAVVELDAIRGEGEAALSLAGRPKLTAKLVTGDIDLTPYAVASGAPAEKPTGKGWGATPVDLGALKLADAELSLRAKSLRFQTYPFGPTRLEAVLKDGKLTADLKETSLFGARGSAQLLADGASAAPGVAMKATLDGVSLRPFLGAAANFNLVEGAGDLTIEIAGQGATLDALMASLAGKGGFQFADGAVNGVDLTALVNEAKAALSSKKLGFSAIGPSKATQFNNLAGNFTISGGVAAIADLKINAGPLKVTGGGALDIGGQKLVLNLFPEYADPARGLDGVGLPLRLSGGWGGVNASVDLDWLLKRALTSARTRLNTEIEKELGKQLGPAFAGIFSSGGRTPAATPAPAPAPASQPADGAAPATQDATAEDAADPAATEPAPPLSPEEAARQELTRALEGLIRRN